VSFSQGIPERRSVGDYGQMAISVCSKWNGIKSSKESSDIDRLFELSECLS
jgi:hypothetical protein